MEWMFNWCQALRELDLSSFDTSSVTKIDWMFQACSKLINIYVGDYWVINADTTTNMMFWNCGTEEVTKI